MAIGGMRGIPVRLSHWKTRPRGSLMLLNHAAAPDRPHPVHVQGMLWETSLLDPEEGIRFRGFSIPELQVTFCNMLEGKACYCTHLA